VPTDENFLANLPEDKEALKAILHSLLQERDRQEKRAEEKLPKFPTTLGAKGNLTRHLLELPRRLIRHCKNTRS
jgi:hypothetical protein